MNNSMFILTVIVVVLTKVDCELFQNGGPFISRSSASSFMTSLEDHVVTVGGTCFKHRGLVREPTNCRSSKYQHLDSSPEEVFQHPVRDQHTAIVDIDIGERHICNGHQYKKKVGDGTRSRHGARPSGVLWGKITRYNHPCRENPCVYGTKCTNIDNYNYTCDCQKGWTGSRCNEDIDECASRPCQNGGICSNLKAKYKCSCPEDFIGVNCETDTCNSSNAKGADIVFAVDSSNSQGNSSFQAQKQYIKDFIAKFDISTASFQVALVSYSLHPTIHCHLNTHSSKITLLTDVDKLTFDGGPSFTGCALEEIREHVLSTANGMRTSLQKYVIVLTDGLSSDIRDTALQAHKLKSLDVTMISVAVGAQIKHSELLNIATESWNVFPLSIPDSVYSILKQHMPQCPDCTRNTSDVIILFDSSTDLAPAEYYPAIDGLRTLVSGMPIGPNNVHVSYVKYTKNIHEEFDFTQYQKSDNVITQITTRLSQHSGPANLSKAFDHVIKNGFDAGKGTRQNTRKFVVAFTQGRFEDFDLVKSRAEDLKKSGVLIAVVGTGTGVNMTALLDIASEPAFTFVTGKDVDVEDGVLLSMSSWFEFDVCEFD